MDKKQESQEEYSNQRMIIVNRALSQEEWEAIEETVKELALKFHSAREKKKAK